ncbi:MAG: VOC family protein [Steroidobacteraceae bacterium]
MIRIRDIDHLVLRVVDLEAMLKFYVGALGCTLERRRDDIGLVQLRAGRSLIDLVPVQGKLGSAGGRTPGARGATSITSACASSPSTRQPSARRSRRPASQGALGSRYGAEGEGPSVYVLDPEGNTVELKGPPWPPGQGPAERGH